MYHFPSPVMKVSEFPVLKSVTDCLAQTAGLPQHGMRKAPEILDEFPAALLQMHIAFVQAKKYLKLLQSLWTLRTLR